MCSGANKQNIPPLEYKQTNSNHTPGTVVVHDQACCQKSPCGGLQDNRVQLSDLVQFRDGGRKGSGPLSDESELIASCCRGFTMCDVLTKVRTLECGGVNGHVASSGSNGC